MTKILDFDKERALETKLEDKNGEEIDTLTLIEQMIGYIYKAGDSSVKEKIDPIGQEIEEALMSFLKKQGIDALSVFSPRTVGFLAGATGFLYYQYIQENNLTIKTTQRDFTPDENKLFEQHKRVKVLNQSLNDLEDYNTDSVADTINHLLQTKQLYIQDLEDIGIPQEVIEQLEDGVDDEEYNPN